MRKDKVELTEKDLNRIKKSARRNAMKKDKFDTTTKSFKNKSKYNRKEKYKENY